MTGYLLEPKSKTSLWFKRLPAGHCFGAVACGGLKTFVPCWVTILLGKWNLELSPGQEDPTSPEAKFIQPFLCMHFKCPALYMLKEITQFICCFFKSTYSFFFYLNLPFLSEVCLHLEIPVICSHSSFFYIHISSSKSYFNTSPPVLFSCSTDRRHRGVHHSFLDLPQRDLLHLECL